MRYRVAHRTAYRYDQAVYESHNELRLSPLATPLQRVQRFNVRSEPRARMFSYKDWLGNVVHYFNVHPLHDRLTIAAESIVSVAPRPTSEAFRTVTTGDFRRERERLHETHYEFLTPSARVPAIGALEGLAPDPEAAADATPLYDLVREATDRVNARLAYDWIATRVDTSLESVLDLGRGASQDFSHLLIGTLRRMGIPARYVSGYGFKIHGTQEEEAAPQGGAGGGGGVVARRRSSHSWVEAALPGVGWCGIDPTHARPVDNRYIKVAVGRDYDDIVPVKGVFRGSGTQALEVDVEIWAVSEADQVEGF